LEALLKRVDGLEARLKDQKAEPDTPTSENAPAIALDGSTASTHPTSNGAAGGNLDADEESQDSVMFSPPEPSR
jgi:hypothetical protein